jgi:Tol biopolymer transport system component
VIREAVPDLRKGDRTVSRLLILSLLAIVCALESLHAQHHGIMFHFPQWSPDGKHILASGTHDGDAELYLIPLDGTSARKLTDNTAADDAGQWIEQGRRILFLSERRGRMERFVMNADGSGQRPTDLEPPVSASPDRHTRIVESMMDGRGVLMALGDNGSRHALTAGPHAEQGSYSPNGKWIVYEQRRAEAPNDVVRSNIVVATANGSQPRVVASGTDPSWSPDGEQILFKTFDPQRGALWIALVRRDGSGLKRLAAGVHPHWSPDGRRIAFMHDGNGRTDIWIMDRNGEGQRCLTCRQAGSTARP